MSKHILEVDSVQMKFKNKLILSDVYLKCKTGEIIGLFGRNGSGKSTLLKIIFGVLKADYKFVRIDGITKNKTSDLFTEISYLPQDNFIPNNFLVKKAISLSVSDETLDDFYKDSNIDPIKDKRIKHLSGGELRYLEIKLILSNSSKFALLDEPYNGLSPIMVDVVNQLIVENSNKKGIIITDHNYKNVIEVSHRLILMKEGKAYNIKDKNELVDKGYLREGMI